MELPDLCFLILKSVVNEKNVLNLIFNLSGKHTRCIIMTLGHLLVVCRLKKKKKEPKLDVAYGVVSVTFKTNSL